MISVSKRLVALGWVVLSATLAYAVPSTISYQGVLTTNGVPYEGTGYFKFALVNAAGNVSYWSNNGTSENGGEPVSAGGVAVPISQGLFDVLLGDISLNYMTQPIPSTIFKTTNLRLRMWFSPVLGGPYTLLAPDQPMSSVGYAMVAGQLMSNAVVNGSSTSAVFRVQQTGSGAGLVVDTATSVAGRAAVQGQAGLTGITINNYAGVQGESYYGRGVVGISHSSDGMLGYSVRGYGVSGQSVSNIGIYAYSQHRPALWAFSQNDAAIHAQGYIEADAYRFNSPRTNYWGVSGDNFRPRTISTNTVFMSAGGSAGGYFASSHRGNSDLLAPLQLPHGATIRRFEAAFSDTAVSGNLIASIMYHNRVGGYLDTTLGQVDSSGIFGKGIQGMNITHVVDNANRYYEVYVRASVNWETVHTNLSIIGVTVMYTTDEAK